MFSRVPEPDLGHVWIFENGDAFSISEVLGFMTLSGTGTFECFVLRFVDGARSICVQTALEPRTWVTYWRGPEPCEYYLSLSIDREGRTVGEVVTREDIELETDDVPDEFYE